MQLNPRATTALGFIFGMGMFSPMFICRSRNSPGLLAALSPSQGDPGDCTHRHNVWIYRHTLALQRTGAGPAEPRSAFGIQIRIKALRNSAIILKKLFGLYCIFYTQQHYHCVAIFYDLLIHQLITLFKIKSGVNKQQDPDPAA